MSLASAEAKRMAVASAPRCAASRKPAFGTAQAHGERPSARGGPKRTGSAQAHGECHACDRARNEGLKPRQTNMQCAAPNKHAVCGAEQTCSVRRGTWRYSLIDLSAYKREGVTHPHPASMSTWNLNMPNP
eukprot:243781-Chlamydomonas_euryale.AAC.2